MLKLTVFVILSVVAFAFADDEPDFIDGIPFEVNYFPLSRAAARVSTVKCDQADGFFKNKCDGDCQTKLLCMGSADPYGEVICPPEAKYCVAGECSTEKDPQNQKCNDVTGGGGSAGFDYKCTAKETFFPDPLNCTQYFYCDASLKLFGYFCPKNFIYDTINMNCKRGTACRAINCDKKVGKNVEFPADPNYYGFCAEINKKISIFMFRCPYPELQMIYDIQDCKFKCTKEERFPDTKSKCVEYNNCVRDGGVFKNYRSSCPAGFVFDKKNDRCVKGTDCIKN